MKPTIKFIGLFPRWSRDLEMVFPGGSVSHMRYGSHESAMAEKEVLESCIATAPDSVEWQGSFNWLTYTAGDKKYHPNHCRGWYECISQENYERVPDDGRCAQCKGWGCCACNHIGGY